MKYNTNDLKTRKLAIKITNETDWDKFRNSLGKEYPYKEFEMSVYVVYDPTWCKKNGSEERDYVCLGKDCDWDWSNEIKKEGYKFININQLG